MFDMYYVADLFYCIVWKKFSSKYISILDLYILTYLIKNTFLRYIYLYIYAAFEETWNYTQWYRTSFIARSSFAIPIISSIFCGDLIAREIILRWIQMSRTFDYFQVRGSLSIIQRRVYSLAKIDYVACLGLNREKIQGTSIANQRRGSESYARK